jgi:MoaA/NifB/PqqE/SkfB family radical SAM enzyme
LTSDAALDLIKYASDLGSGTVLASNAYLIDEDMAKRIADSGLKEICISLDSFNEDTHDYLRGVKGSYKRVIRAIDYLGKYAKNVQIKINTVISAINLEGMIDLAAWVIEDPRIVSVNFLAVTQPFDTRSEDNWYEKDEYSFLWPKYPEKADQIMDGLIKLKEGNVNKIFNPSSQFKVYKAYFRDPKHYFKQTGCHIYKRVLNVSSNGEMSVCFFMDPIGNIKQENIDMEKLWNSESAYQVRDTVKKCTRNCHLRVNCYFEE